MKKNILVIGPYLPGKSFGGPVKSLLNLVENLSDCFNFYIITGDRDLNAQEVYTDVIIGSWNQIGKAKVFYMPKGTEFKNIKSIIKQIDYDLVYSNSFFSKNSLIVQVLKYINFVKKPVIVAPRGEFSSGALTYKSTKKNVFLWIYKLLNVQKKLSYTSTSIKDQQDILKILGNDVKVNIVGNIVSGNFKKSNSINVKLPGYIRIATLSRVSKIKNIDFSLRLLETIDNDVDSFEKIEFDIYGPLEDKDYWNECLAISRNLSKRVNVNFKGAIEYNDVIEILSNYHLFLFPTKGENFGHVIQEAFLSGCPVIISDQTPWRELLNMGVGFDISLKNEKEFIKAIKSYLYMDEENYKLVSKKAYEYGKKKVEQQLSITEHIDMFNSEMKL